MTKSTGDTGGTFMSGEDIRIDLGLLRTLLSVSEDAPLWMIVDAARKKKSSLPPLILSMVEREGETLGSGSCDELRRTRNRHDTYVAVASTVTSNVPARIMKGPSIANCYPTGLVRPVGDLDLVVPDEETLWQAVDLVIGQHHSAEMYVTLFGHPDRHILVTLEWPADDPFMDPDLTVEICTAAFPGDHGAVGIRPGLPHNQSLANLVALGEERFQRTFGVTDVLDVLVLGGTNLPAVNEIVATVDAYQLAPEIDELLGLAHEYIGATSILGDVATRLDDAVGPEQARRRQWVAQTVEPGMDRLEAALATGKSVGGLLLRRTDPEPAMRRCTTHNFMTGTILRTPVGDYLLSSEPVVTRAQYDAALAYLSQLGERMA